MKAIRVHEPGGPEVLRYEDVPDPNAGEGEVLVRIRAAGINPVDTYIRAGTYGRIPPYPYIPGGDAAGVVEAVGPGVRRFRVGDRVYTAGGAGGLLTGGHADLVTCRESQVHPLPECVPFPQGAGIGVPYATAYRALLHKARARPGEKVFIHGASGGVGLAAVQLAVAAGMEVVGSAGTPQGRRLVAEQGADLVLDHTGEGYLEELLEWTAGRGADVILEMVAHVNLRKDLGVIAAFGRIVVVGSRGTLEIDPRGAMSQDASILGLALMNTPVDEMASIHAALVAGLRSGVLRPVVGSGFPLKEAHRGHRAISEPGTYGKIYLTP